MMLLPGFQRKLLSILKIFHYPWSGVLSLVIRLGRNLDGSLQVLVHLLPQREERNFRLNQLPSFQRDLPDLVQQGT